MPISLGRPGQGRSRLAWLGAAALGASCAATFVWLALGAPPAAAGSNDAALPFTFVQEFYGPGGYTDPLLQRNRADGMMNGIALSPPVDMAVADSVMGSESLVLRMPGAALPSGLSQNQLDRYVASFSNLAPSLSSTGLFWNLLPEWDQSGGAWVPHGRPIYAAASRPGAYDIFSRYYRAMYPELIAHLQTPAESERPYRLAAITDHSPNVFYAYELGAELQMLERGIDELGDLSTGIAYLRGAARQFGRPWGIDISSWRTSTEGATQYAPGGQLLSGWSAEYLERIYYLSFASGARMIHNEAANYRYPNGELNPLGEATQRFSDFALRRHPDVGQPTVNVALLVDHFGGFDPKHGVNNQRSAVWYQDIPYSAGDHMFDNLLRISYPGHWLHGLAPGASFANREGVPNTASFVQFLAQAGDPHPYEPMPTTRWGDNIDVITTHATAEVFSHYKVIVLTGDVMLEGDLREDLRAWVEQGGVLVVNSEQVSHNDDSFLGVQFVAQPPRVAAHSRWIWDRSPQDEPSFSYTPIRTAGAKVLAFTDTNDPLITSRTWGAGEVLMSTPAYLQSKDQQALLNVGIQLLDLVSSRFEPVQVWGDPIAYVVSRPVGKVIVTFANTTGKAWVGSIKIPASSSPARVIEYTSDQPLEFEVSDNTLVVPAEVPAYGVRVIAIEQQ